ncbi:MAG: N-acetylmuramic acid 6-phosphate etherase [Caloramator sp.]|uniref:N-acetylmuramic acid 6-phosphate etherase n=1 Tax=Caloramator sp. TaxID=1871330 RepID=UPI001D6A44C2|nr:N-acetylmuramic acid 6-phosphate etherase [Caloramator sp.]MBZ4662745.1 N-acetylmuramic acid 6-phosphate etherase [Caloramator sp.]
MDKINLANLTTESINPNTKDIDRVSTLDMVTMINEEDKKVAFAIEKEKESIAKAIDLIAERLLEGGRLIYVGAGTSGRLGILDASECPPTFGVDYDLVQGVIAGGNTAMFKAVEGAEDDEELGRKDMIEKNLNGKDVVCGIAASGRTPYVIGAMKYAKEIGALTIAVNMNKKSIMNEYADVAISVEVGPEVIMGSTRMKAGTAQKMILNMLSTGTMIKLGKVYQNLMVDVQASNKKLYERAKRIVKIATGEDDLVIETILDKTDYNVKLSILMIKTGLTKEEAKRLLEKNRGYIIKALKEYEEGLIK